MSEENKDEEPMLEPKQAPQAKQTAPGNPAPPNQSTTTSWWGSLISTVTSTGNQIIDACTEDLKDFGSVLHTDTKTFVSKHTEDPEKLATKVTSGLATSISNVWGSIVPVMPTSNTASTITPASKSYEDIVNDPAFIKWKEQFNFDAKTKEIAHILAENPDVKEIHEQMVPSHLSPNEFWERYFFRVNKQQREEKRREHLKQMADSISETETEQIDWGLDDEDDEIDEKGEGEGDTDEVKQPEQAPADERKDSEGKETSKESNENATETTNENVDNEENKDTEDQDTEDDDEVFNWS